jgi:hypothetical protein
MLAQLAIPNTPLAKKRGGLTRGITVDNIAASSISLSQPRCISTIPRAAWLCS